VFGDGGSGFRFVVARLIIAVVLIGGLIWWLSPGRGEEEFIETQNALRKAMTWRIESAFESGTQSHASLVEIVCPNNIHVRRDVTFSDGTPPFRIEEIRIGMDKYTWKPGGEWERNLGELPPYQYICRAMHQGQDLEPMPPFLMFVKRGVIRKGEKMTVHGESCREWTVQIPDSPGSLRTERICISENDHLPRRRITPESTFLYTAWNTPIHISAPLQE
jgi:hypothetical protein